MRDVKDGTPGEQLRRQVLDTGARPRVEGRERLVEQHHRPVLHQRPSQRDPLPLSA